MLSRTVRVVVDPGLSWPTSLRHQDRCCTHIVTPHLDLPGIAGDTSAAPPPRSMPPTLPPTQPQAHGRTLQEWAQTLVSEMTGAQGLEDAQGRATQVLQAFQQALLSAQDKVSQMHPHFAALQRA